MVTPVQECRHSNALVLPPFFNTCTVLHSDSIDFSICYSFYSIRRGPLQIIRSIRRNGLASVCPKVSILIPSLPVLLEFSVSSVALFLVLTLSSSLFTQDDLLHVCVHIANASILHKCFS